MTRYALYDELIREAEMKCAFGGFFTRFFSRIKFWFWKYKQNSLTVGEAEKEITVRP